MTHIERYNLVSIYVLAIIAIQLYALNATLLGDVVLGKQLQFASLLTLGFLIISFTFEVIADAIKARKAKKLSDGK